MVKTFDRKISEDGKIWYTLKQIGDNFVIFKSRVGAEADFADNLGEFTNLEKANESFKNIVKYIEIK